MRRVSVCLLLLSFLLVLGLLSLPTGHPEDSSAQVVAATDVGGLPVVSARSPKGCRTVRQRRRLRCRSEQIGKPGRVLSVKNIPGRGGVGDQYLPFDNGKQVVVTQGNNYPVSHNNVYTRYGWDFGVPVGTTLRATAAGRVERALGGCNPTVRQSACNAGWGNTVVVRLADGSCARFGHLSAIAVSPGQSIGRYHVIGRSGNSGNSFGAHLHYQRENCASRAAIPSTFIEAGSPIYPNRVTSRNAEEAPAPAPSPEPPSPQPLITPPPASLPQAPAVDRFAVASFNFVGQGNYWAYTWWSWDQFVAQSNTITHVGVVVGNPNLQSGLPVPYTLRLRVCSSQPDGAGNCTAVSDNTAGVINYGLTAVDTGDVPVQPGRTYWLLANMPPKVNTRDWDTFWAATKSGKAPGQRDSIGQTYNMNALVRGYNR